MNERTMDCHSANCYFCGELFDERTSAGTIPDGGEVCQDPACYWRRVLAWAEAPNTRVKVWASVEIINNEHDVYMDVVGPVCLLESFDLVPTLLWLDQHNITTYGDDEPAHVIGQLKIAQAKEKKAQDG